MTDTTTQQEREAQVISVRASAVDWLKKHYPELCEKSGLCERVAGRLYTRTTLTPRDEPPDPQLCKFYGVTTDAELIAAQTKHIERLQAKLSPTPSLAPKRVREG